MASRYVVVKFGDLTRGESMNIGVLSWEHTHGNPAVLVRLIDDWSRVAAAFPHSGATTWVKDDVIQRLTTIRTLWDYNRAREQMGPYCAYEFTEERPSTLSAEETLKSTAEFFLEHK